MKRILFIATESAPGMIPYTSSVINALSKSNEFEIYAVVVNSGKRSYRNYLKGVEHIEYIEYPRSKLLKLIYKIYPARIIHTIKRTAKTHKIDAIHLLTGDFSLFFYILCQRPKERLYYTVHDLNQHDRYNDFSRQALAQIRRMVYTYLPENHSESNDIIATSVRNFKKKLPE